MRQTCRRTSCSNVKFRTEAWVEWFVLSQLRQKYRTQSLSCPALITATTQAVPKRALNMIQFPGNDVTNTRKNTATIGCDAFDNVRHLSEDSAAAEVYTLVQQFAKIFLLAIPSLRTCVVLSSWMCVGMVPFHLFNVEKKLWPDCFCFRHTSIANSQTPGRFELVGLFSIQGPTQYFSW